MLTRRAFFGTMLGTLAYTQSAFAVPALYFGRQQTLAQASGSLTTYEAWSLAERMLHLHHRGETRLSAYQVFLFRMAGTGSMRPSIGDGDVVIMEMAPFEALGPGDVVWWIDETQVVWAINGERGPLSVLHRITRSVDGGWKTRGDNNNDADPGIVTKTHYRARVCQVIHCQKARA